MRASEEDPRLLGSTIPPLGREVLKPQLSGRRAFRVLNWHQGPDQDVSDGVWLTPFEDGLLRSLDGLTPAYAFKEALGVDEFRLRFALHRLRQMGLVEGASGGAAAEVGASAGRRRPRGRPPRGSRRRARSARHDRGARPSRQGGARDARSRPPWTELGGQLGDLSRAFSYVLAGGLAVVVLALVLWGGSAPRLHQPFPWQEAEPAAAREPAAPGPGARSDRQAQDLPHSLRHLPARPAAAGRHRPGPPRRHRGQPRARRRLRGARRRLRPRARGGGRRAPGAPAHPLLGGAATSCSIPTSSGSTVLPAARRSRSSTRARLPERPRLGPFRARFRAAGNKVE